VTAIGHDSLNTRRTLKSGGKDFDYYSIDAAGEAVDMDFSRLPFSMKVLLENMLRFEDGRSVKTDDVKAFGTWLQSGKSTHEIAYRPARVLLQDFTGVPAVVDLAAMREALQMLGGDPQQINPLTPVDLVIDHSVSIDSFTGPTAFADNVKLEFERNMERYEFLKWGQQAFKNFRVVPPGTGICHQVNLEYLAQTVWTSQDENGKTIAYPDTVVGTDSHTTMVDALGVLGWGVGGIEAEAGMLGQPISMLIPEVIGFKMTGKPREGVTATDIVLTVTEMLRKKGVVQKFVEYFGPGVFELGLADRATISNMTPEYGATCGIFPIDAETLRYLTFTGRDDAQVKLVEDYARAQGLWLDDDTPEAIFTDTLELDLSTVVPSLAGPKRPQDRVSLSDMTASAKSSMEEMGSGVSTQAEGEDFTLDPGDVVISAITSCTNTSNPSVLIGAGLLAKNAIEKGLMTKPWIKKSLAPGSQVVADYLEKAGLQTYFDQLGFRLVAFGCTTCIGNSGPLPEAVHNAIEKGDVTVGAVLSGNRNFEGRVHPMTKLNYLASPPLVVAYAIAGSLNVDLTTDPLGQDQDGNDVYLKDIWPTNKEISDTITTSLSPDMYRARYANVEEGPKEWKEVHAPSSELYQWNSGSTYVQNPPYFEGMTMEPAPITDIHGARPILVLGDSITTDHISPAGNIQKVSPAGEFLLEHQVRPDMFNVYGCRRGAHEVMMRGTFANIRIKNEIAAGTEGGFATHHPSGDVLPVYTAAMRYKEEGTPTVVFGGKDYGMGSSRDWAAKGTFLLGIRAVVVESYERIHRSNLIGMGVVPLQFKDGMTRNELKLDGSELFDFTGIEGGITPGMDVQCKLTRKDGSVEEFGLLCRIDTLDEVEYYRHGGILQMVIRQIIEDKKAA
jgi:aconitate hydratase